MPTVEYDKMFVKDLKKVMAEKPVAYLPLGTPEMHGEHLTLGQDAIKAHELCKRIAEKGGGAVLPALHAGTHVPMSFNFGNIYISPGVTRALYQEYMQELARVGFRVIVAVTGHYPNCQVAITKHAAADASELSGAWIAGVPEYELAFDLDYTGDHAGKWETSIYWHLRPDLVCMDNLPKDPNVRLIAAGPEDPRVHASQELGAKVCNAIADRMVVFVDKLLEFDKDPITHGPSHSQMRSASRHMARIYEERSKGNPRLIKEFQEA
ncbi:MAG: creatininase family protein, partial [Armatimonadetes bacterium]|nr:creatininase family protein [Armatimonadota bacterium]